jgi:DNA-binding response OmpR family regulator
MGKPVILLVDDEPELRGLAALVLQRENFTVLVAGHAAEALSVAQTTPIDLLITDIHMGDENMNGLELARLLRSKNPGIGVLVMSGTPDSEILAAQDELVFLKKPFTPGSLAAKACEMVPQASDYRGSGENTVTKYKRSA